jgi:UDP-N-acetylmuramoyl-tripeptide--D-alanyl-D-alanine ligase
MIALTVAEIAEATGGVIHGADPSTEILDIAVDSRGVTPSSMFVAIRGEQVDGHVFAAAAINAGASVVLAAHELEVPCLVVDDPVLALGRLAHWVRTRYLNCQVIAITGSSGKTSTKDLLAQILTSVGPTVAAQGSFNTEIGVPLTVLRADQDTQFLVLEMGMRGEGHIRYLCEMAEPSVSVLINVGSAHIGVVGSLAGIASAKGEILELLPVAGTAVVYGDDGMVLQQAARTRAEVITFGEGVTCDVRATDVRLDDQARPSFTLHRGDEAVPVRLLLHGEHAMLNALAASGGAMAVGIGIEAVAQALCSATAQSRWRMEVSEAPGGFTVINDSYNANPESMRAALKTLAAMAEGRRSWAVIGEMRELGEESRTEHDAMGRLVVRLDISQLICIGTGTKVMHLAASNEGSWGDEAMWVADADEAISVLKDALAPGDVVLIKASRSIGLERIAAALLEDASS